MRPIAANSADQLLTQLRRIDITVSPRAGGRTKEQVERSSTCRFLATYADTGLLDYPVHVTPRDRPDVLLTHAFAKVGIEITEAIPADWAKVSALHTQRNYINPIPYPRFILGEESRSTEELDLIARGGHVGTAWGGDSPEREWAEAMHYFTQEKIKKLNKQGFDRFDQDWLLIYDNWPVPGIDEHLAASYFCKRLAAESSSIPFQSVFVERNRSFWRFSKVRRVELQLMTYGKTIIQVLTNLN